MARGRKVWTDEDNEIFRDLSTRVEAAREIADWFNVTVCAVYNRGKKLGITLQKPIPKDLYDNPLKLRIWLWENKISPYLEKNGNCLEWGYASYHGGYGQIRINKNLLLQTHRISYEVANNVILTPDQKVLHKCDNPCCNNPEHLFQGTHVENARDMMKKNRGRGQFPKGHNAKVVVLNGQAKTVDEWVTITGFKKETILRRLKAGWLPNDVLSVIPKIGRNQLSGYGR